MTSRPAPDTPIVTRLFHLLPKQLQGFIKSGMKRVDFLLLLRFYFGTKNILREKGWFQSERRGVPVDYNGEPTPWYTYPMIDFLEPRLGGTLRVFEYGGGYSTLWYADRVASVVAVEDSKKWAEIVTERLPENGDVIYQPTRDDYTGEVREHEAFDIVVIDGAYRTDCIDPALEALSEEGVIIWDDFEWLDESDYHQLIDEEFSLLPFHGLKALGANYKMTTIFYRDDNCLGI